MGSCLSKRRLSLRGKWPKKGSTTQQQQSHEMRRFRKAESEPDPDQQRKRNEFTGQRCLLRRSSEVRVRQDARPVYTEDILDLCRSFQAYSPLDRFAKRYNRRKREVAAEARRPSIAPFDPYAGVIRQEVHDGPKRSVQVVKKAITPRKEGQQAVSVLYDDRVVVQYRQENPFGRRATWEGDGALRSPQSRQVSRTRTLRASR
jgi:hypothetical protein